MRRLLFPAKRHFRAFTSVLHRFGLHLPHALARDAQQFTSLMKLGIGRPNTSPQRKQVNPRVAIFKQVGTRAFGTAFTRWRVRLVLILSRHSVNVFKGGTKMPVWSDRLLKFFQERIFGYQINSSMGTPSVRIGMGRPLRSL
ncbi:MAG TPA: hypothetical protein VMM76_28445 [Pirellulaceae bacterium]|nr:hypothetical protein [Pirellulaceae bacterium]